MRPIDDPQNLGDPVRIHAVTIHHRGREMLDVCLRTLLSSESVDLQVIVVLNGCDEELPAVAHESDRVHVISAEQPVGFSAANNLGTDWAATNIGKPDYYYFINNDTRSENDSLALQVAALEADPKAAVAGPTLLIDWATDYLNSLCLNVTHDAWGWDEGIGISLAEYGPLPGRRSVLAVTGSAILVDAAVHEEIGGWTVLYDYYFEDIDLCLKVRGAGYEVVHEPAAVVGHHVSATMTLESDFKVYLFYRNRLLVALVHWPLRMLAGLLRFAVVDEVLRRPKEETETRRKALFGAFKKLPRALLARWRFRGRKDWVAMLRPQGSVPVITLPEKPTVVDPGLDEVESSVETWAGLEGFDPSADDGRRVMLFGCSPLPFENQRMNFAPGFRTWQFANALSRDGHAVCVIAMRIPGSHGDDLPPIELHLEAGIRIFTMDEDDFRRPNVVESAVAAFRPDVIIGCSSTVPALRAVEVAENRPVWIDLFGDLRAEAQSRLEVYPDGDLRSYRDVLVELLGRGDCFSAVSERQRFNAIGQLGLVGRLNRENIGTELVHTIPCCVSDNGGSAPLESSTAVDGEFDSDDFIVLWSGGFNTWCDVDTLFEGVERAMSNNGSVRLLVTGGAIDGHDDRTYPRFLDRVERSEYCDRFVIKGQIEANQLAAYVERADVGIVTERRLMERTLGSSGRTLNWIEAGLPVICTAISELGSELEDHDLASIYRPCDPEDLSRIILEVASDPGTARDRATRGRLYALEHWSESATTTPLRRWVKTPGRSPDAESDNPLSVASLIGSNQQLNETRIELAEQRANYHQLRSELGSIHQSRMWKIWMLYLNFTGIIRVRGRSARPAQDDDR